MLKALCLKLFQLIEGVLKIVNDEDSNHEQFSEVEENVLIMIIEMIMDDLWYLVSLIDNK